MDWFVQYHFEIPTLYVFYYRRYALVCVRVHACVHASIVLSMKCNIKIFCCGVSLLHLGKLWAHCDRTPPVFAGIVLSCTRTHCIVWTSSEYIIFLKYILTYRWLQGCSGCLCMCVRRNLVSWISITGSQPEFSPHSKDAGRLEGWAPTVGEKGEVRGSLFHLIQRTSCNCWLYPVVQ